MVFKSARSTVLLSGLCALLVGCADGSSQLVDSAPGGVLGAPDSVTYTQAVADEYRISPQDRLSINIYPVRDFSIPSVRVAGDGSVLVPAVGPVQAAGKSTRQLSQEIQDKLAACCLQKPMVVVQVEETVSQQITVAGAVKQSNVYNLKGRTTLLQAISMAGGADPSSADLRRVGIIRMTNGQRTGKVFNLKDIQAGRADDPEVFGGDKIVVDTSGGKGAWKAVMQAMPLSAFFAVF